MVSRLRRWLKSRLAEAAGGSGRFADFFFLLDHTFRREHAAVLAGLQRHRASRSEAGGGAVHALRRNIHRLEKGLISQPRKPVFATAYITETVELYLKLRGANGCADEGRLRLLDWCEGVLREYFAVAGQAPEIDAARCRLEDARVHWRPESQGCAPYVRDQEPLAVNYEGLCQLARRRRSVRWFRPDPVPRAVIDRAVEIAAQSPSACNRQPFEFRVFDDPALAAQVASIPVGTSGFSQQYPCFVVVVGRLDAFEDGADRHVIYVDGSLAAMSLAFALEVQGVSSCLVNWRDDAEREQQMARLLGLEPCERVVVCMALGFADPDARVPFSQKKSLDELRSYNHAAGSARVAQAADGNGHGVPR